MVLRVDELTLQLTQVAGALAILAAFALLQFHLVSPARAPC
jgi:hypothetical protein